MEKVLVSRPKGNIPFYCFASLFNGLLALSEWGEALHQWCCLSSRLFWPNTSSSQWMVYIEKQKYGYVLMELTHICLLTMWLKAHSSEYQNVLWSPLNVLICCSAIQCTYILSPTYNGRISPPTTGEATHISTLEWQGGHKERKKMLTCTCYLLISFKCGESNHT